MALRPFSFLLVNWLIAGWQRRSRPALGARTAPCIANHLRAFSRACRLLGGLPATTGGHNPRERHPALRTPQHAERCNARRNLETLLAAGT